MAESKKKDNITVIIVSVWVLALSLVAVLYIMYIADIMLGIINMVLLNVLFWYLLLIPTIYFMRRDKEGLRDIGFTNNKLPKQILLGIILTIGTVSVFGLGMSLLFNVFSFNWSELPNINIGFFAFTFVMQFITIALVEEIIFRGHMFKKLQDNRNSSWLAIIVSSIVFGALHIPSFVFLGNELLTVSGWYFVLIATLIGVVYGMCRAKGATMITLIFAHALHNATMGTLSHIFY